MSRGQTLSCIISVYFFIRSEYEAHVFAVAVDLVLSCALKFLTLSNIPGIKSGKTGKDIVYKAIYLTPC